VLSVKGITRSGDNRKKKKKLIEVKKEEKFEKAHYFPVEDVFQAEQD